ncbi:tryptophan--tRNA ligase [Desulfobotulus sp. H1]|uniref:Tryptophan--tRNA ligase n=1 Tax=Desulfobotulus pelophilus TaxID=2823377 RepID=A0ABT3N9Q8_9BACT|nr:tryptophan--tRNA ligase [Desulfobotulus pelophilus]MCW7754195.1 tryptophan--tRNA ligase [Desulfobotulus pelophilus]
MTEKKRILTGITTTGTPHLGNYVGAIRPAIEASQNPEMDAFYFLADYHSLIKCHEPARVAASRMEVAATWLALGLDTDNATFYRQSDIPEIPELTWILTCVTAKGLLNRAHAYKAAVQINEEEKANDPDKGITMGLFSYPVLMAADILMFNASKVPVGRDQIQHIEMARDIGGRFNHIFGQTFTMPEAVVDDKAAVLSGIDGRKMSKSYDNTIPLFLPEKQLRKLIMKIKTNSLAPSEPKNPDECTLFEIYKAFASKEEAETIRLRYAEGIGWGDMKTLLFEHLNELLKEPRERYAELLADPAKTEKILQEGAEKARCTAAPFLAEIRKKTGLIPFI